MLVAIVHYHLQSGGVTRIIENTVKALQDSDVSVVVLTGQAPESEWPGAYRVIPGLQYEVHRPLISAGQLARELESAARDALGGIPDIWHVHNHSLGKNMALPGALWQMADRGCRLLLHIHDFAEDGRPANYRQMLESIAGGERSQLSRLLYPAGPHVHYGVLNSRDHYFLQRAGADLSCLHLLPNPVCLTDTTPFSPEKQMPRGEQLWLYSTRAIRRKNIGEFLLWSTIAEPGNRFATTLGPQNPKERPIYEHWQQVAAELKLPVDFELAKRAACGFLGLFKRARGLITTSIAEGFGMAFLEPWLLGKPVYGRDLAEITEEFREEGICLSLLYERLDVPLKWLRLETIVDKARLGLQKNLAAYGRCPTEEDVQRLLNVWIRGDLIDFGRLDEELQEMVLRRVAADPGVGRDMNPPSLPSVDVCAEEVAENQRILAERYSLRGYGKRLLAVYQALAASESARVGNLDGESLLDSFLEPERLALLRVD